jgi:hypothetical protein
MLETAMMQRNQRPSEMGSVQTGHDSTKWNLPRPDLDEVNDASFDSFPASDPPTWSSMHAGAPQIDAARET